MLNLPSDLMTVIVGFAPLFSKRVWLHAQVLLVGAILAPGKRTVTSALRAMGMSTEQHFQNYHRFLNRAVWSSREASRILLRLLIATFSPSGTIVLGLDDTLERRRGAKIKALGIYHDPVRSSKSHFVKSSGLRWLSLMLLVRIPWAGRVWALPFLTVLAPSERYNLQHLRRHKKVTDWGRQLFLQARRWLPEREIVAVADRTYAALELLTCLSQRRHPVHVVTRLRLDAVLCKPAPRRKDGVRGRPRVAGARLPKMTQVLSDPKTSWTRVKMRYWYNEGRREVDVATGQAVWYSGGLPAVPIRWVLVRDPLGKFSPQALLCTKPEVSAEQVLAWFVMRWSIEVTFQEMRAHLGMETQRQWSRLAIRRTTPALFGLFSVVALLAVQMMKENQLPVRQAAWYRKQRPTFADAIALVRQRLWHEVNICVSQGKGETIKIPRALYKRITEALCYAA